MSDRTETIERALAAYNRHDGAGFASYFAEDGVMRVVALGEAAEGREQIQAALEGYWRALDYTLELRSLYYFDSATLLRQLGMLPEPEAARSI